MPTVGNRPANRGRQVKVRALTTGGDDDRLPSASAARASTCAAATATGATATTTRTAEIRDCAAPRLMRASPRRRIRDGPLVADGRARKEQHITMTTKPTNEERCNEGFSSTLPREALEAVHGGAQYNCADADGVVPESYGRYGGSWLGITDTLSRTPCQRAIRYDTYNMRNAGPNDWSRLRAHERAHARGWDHGQGTPSTNPAHSPYVNITGQ